MVKLDLQKLIADCGKPESVANEIGMHFTSVYRWLKHGDINGNSLAKVVHHYDVDIHKYIVED